MTKEKQIEEMAVDLCRIDLCKHLEEEQCDATTCVHCSAEALYNAGYRKQSEGKWTRFEVSGVNYGQVYYQHKECTVNETQLFTCPHKFCPNCGAKMKSIQEDN